MVLTVVTDVDKTAPLLSWNINIINVRNGQIRRPGTGCGEVLTRLITVPHIDGNINNVKNCQIRRQ